MLNKIQPLAFVAGAALFAPNFAAAQPAGHADATPVIEVLGRGTVTKPAEWASITGVVRAQGKDQQTALRLMSAKQDAISSGLAELAGAKAVKVEAAELRFAPVLPPGCRADDDSYPRAAGAVPKSCAPTGVMGSVKLTVTVHPAEKLGSLASLAVQFGAEDVQVAESGVDDQGALEAAAARAAYGQALAQATLLAGAANEHLGKLVRVNRGASNDNDDRTDRFNGSTEVRVTAMKREAPLVDLKLTPRNVTESSWVVVTFELVK